MTLPSLLLLLAAAVDGCHPVAGDRILGKDLAAATPAFAGLPEDAVVGYAPVPGAQRLLRPDELRRLARVHGLDYSESDGICFEWPTASLSADRMAAAMRTSLDNPGARIEILDWSRFPAPAGELVFPREFLPASSSMDTSKGVRWKGYIRYAGSRRFNVWATVKLAAETTRVVSVAPLRAGEPIQPHQVTLETTELFPGRERFASSIEEAVGRLPRKPLAAGTPLPLSLLDAPLEVAKGDLVEVVAQAGAARIRVEARAETGGRRGDSIRVRNLESGKTFSARVSARGQVLAHSRGESK